MVNLYKRPKIIFSKIIQPILRTFPQEYQENKYMSPYMWCHSRKEKNIHKTATVTWHRHRKTGSCYTRKDRKEEKMAETQTVKQMDSSDARSKVQKKENDGKT